MTERRMVDILKPAWGWIFRMKCIFEFLRQKNTRQKVFNTCAMFINMVMNNDVNNLLTSLLSVSMCHTLSDSVKKIPLHGNVGILNHDLFYQRISCKC